jgi:KDO2-lipid IV(A) lauroyltransferase
MERREFLSQLAQGVRFDGLFWRKLARLGSVHAPEWFKRGSPPLIAALFFALVGEKRRGAVQNLQRVLGTDRWTAGWAALRMFSEFAFCTSEAMEQASARCRPLRIDRPAQDAVVDALRGGRGVVVVTAHLGSWDIAAKALRDLQWPINVVMAREVNASAQEWTRAGREQAGVRVIVGDASVFSSFGMVRALRQNEIVAMQLDRMPGARGARLLPFLGAPAPFPSGPFVLARLAGAPVIPVFIPRLGARHYRVHIGEPIQVPREARDPVQLDEVMLRAVRQLEEAVRRHPLQWFQFAPFWPEPQAAQQGDAEEERARRA